MCLTKTTPSSGNSERRPFTYPTVYTFNVPITYFRCADEKNSYSTLAQESDQEGDRGANWDRGSAFSFYNSNPDSDSASAGDSSSSIGDSPPDGFIAWILTSLMVGVALGYAIGKYTRKKREQQSAVHISTLEGLAWLASINTVHSSLYSSAAASAPPFPPTCLKKY
ncbi:hypothetical protein OROMI_003333 [Orobanche minor]